MEEMKKEMEKMKDQIKSLRLHYRILSICFIVTTIGSDVVKNIKVNTERGEKNEM